MRSKAKPEAEAEAIVTADAREVLTIDQIVDRYHRQWIPLQITESNGDWPEAGIIVVRGPTRDSIQSPMLAILRTAADTGKQYYIFRALPRYRNWDEWRASRDENWRPRRTGGRSKR